ncbi:MAG: hypothetical protein HYU77_14995 [Betaproteobacteria bacterium]|nr:hypothetical protein [Betaproteobacteria bacterium]
MTSAKISASRFVPGVRIAATAILFLAALANGHAAGRGSFDLAPLPARSPVNPALAELGRHLFFDPRLSGDWSRSCAPCHGPGRGFGDGEPLSRAYPGAEYFRNSPTLINVRHRLRLMWDGRLDGADLGTAVRDMVTEAHFMNADGRLVQERIRQVPEYRAMWEKAFGPGSEPYGPRLFSAVGEFLNTLESRNAPLDRYLRGDNSALGSRAKRGLDLFRGKAGCIRCHHGPLLSDGALHRTGVPENPEVLANPLRTIAMLRHYATSGMPNYMKARTDLGAYAITKDGRDRGRFLTPSLRELKHTAPYMHNGVFRTLAEVIEFYDRGGAAGSELKPLGLTATEKKALLTFLAALSGDRITVAEPEYLDFELRAEDRSAPVQASDPPESVAAAATGYPPLASLPPVLVPADNPQSAGKIELGRMLFFDGRLSGDGSTPCVSCHFPQLGWGEGGSLSRGYPGTKHWRNAQSVLNAAYYPKLFWDGAVGSLEAQAASAAEGAVAGNGDPAMMEMRLRLVPDYVERFRRVFGAEWPRITHAWQAIAAFERTLVSDPKRVPFDRHLNGDRSALGADELRGYALFTGKAGCIACHNGPLASDQRFHATGVPANDLFAGNPLHQITRRWQHYQKGVPEARYRENPQDMGHYYLTKNPADIGKFRTPSLRELKYTAPYMHNGVFATLAQVVDFYDRGGGGIPSKSPILKPLQLTREEKKDLVAFLESLSMDEPLLLPEPKLPGYAALKPDGIHEARTDAASRGH